ncbi:unnamed protein product [Periconia digitata]|uniref:Rhodopsin domain-containing protein n=1 Tax=Periconia digitata TaxID=1303443 RepID=A0A9W4U9E5_9PLEO|nr:unnamed protein product [Periconia digitata]
MGSPGNTISSTHRGPAVDIAIWLCFILCALSIVAKVWTKLGRRGREYQLGNLQLDDYLLVVSLAALAAYSVTVSQQVKAGLGKRLEDVDVRDVPKYEKTEYASHFLYIAAISSANAAGVVFGLMLEPSPSSLRMLQVTMGINILWFLTSTFATAFQCATPTPWHSINGKCFDRVAFWTTIDLINALLNICLAGILCRIVGILQMSRTRYLLLILFSSRILILIPTSFKISYLFKQRTSTPYDPTSTSVDVVISSILVATTTVMATSLPFMNPVMEHLQPGWATGAVRLSVGVDQRPPVTATSSGKREGDGSYIMETRSFKVESEARTQREGA